jgi:hypothetical protein
MSRGVSLKPTRLLEVIPRGRSLWLVNEAEGAPDLSIAQIMPNLPAA